VLFICPQQLPVILRCYCTLPVAGDLAQQGASPEDSNHQQGKDNPLDDKALKQTHVQGALCPAMAYAAPAAQTFRIIDP